MKNLFPVLCILLIGYAGIAQEIQQEAVAINIEIPVRVFDGNEFVDSLTLQDFEVLENGLLQELEAVYLIKEAAIERQDLPKLEQTVIQPNVTRHFLMLFEIIDYLPQIKAALTDFFLNVIVSGDSLLVVTPLKTYDLLDDAFTKMTNLEIAEVLNDKIRKDVIRGNAEYKSLIRELSSPLTSTPELRMMLLRQLRDYKQFDQQGVLESAEYMKSLAGQKHVFLFYQKEGIPVPRDMDIFNRVELRKEINFNEQKIEEAFSDSSISVHFLYITKENRASYDLSDPRAIRSTEIFDQSAPIFGAFKKMAQVTGGISESSQNISWSLNQAAQASGNYYLLYYKPQDYVADGSFKKIEVKIKGRRYRITHRTGYIAD